MALKHRLYHWYKIIRQLKTWQLVLILVVCVLISAFLLRQNNLEMVRLRQAVEQTDQQGGDVVAALKNLQRYVTSHMNTDLGEGIALQYSYQRDYEAALQAVASSSNPQAALYAKVEEECRPVFQRTHSFPAYTQCAHDKLSQLSPGQDALSSLKTPAPELYKVNYISPVWSFDAAGIAVVVTFLVVLMLVGRTLSYVILRAMLGAHR
ncbi:MAG TPA: hypothetical protein VLA88_01565 [Candidatus Saccharimonadales bacterium]|nr:hypothetical protein [Candidatus Saccharimonadales bacterium]